MPNPENICLGLIMILKEFQKDLPENKRIIMWMSLQEGYCMYCGKYIGDAGFNARCHCDNEE